MRDNTHMPVGLLMQAQVERRLALADLPQLGEKPPTFPIGWVLALVVWSFVFTVAVFCQYR